MATYLAPIGQHRPRQAATCTRTCTREGFLLGQVLGRGSYADWTYDSDSKQTPQASNACCNVTRLLSDAVPPEAQRSSQHPTSSPRPAADFAGITVCAQPCIAVS